MPEPVQLPKDVGVAVHDFTDALLRDPNTPEAVRTVVSDVYNVVSYLDKIEFQKDDNGYVTVHPKTERDETDELAVEPDVPVPADADNNGGNGPTA